MRNLPRWCCCRGCSFGTFQVFGGVWSGIRPSVYTYQENMCLLPKWTVGGGPVMRPREERACVETSRGDIGGGGGTGRLEDLHCSVGDACRRWSHMWESWYFPRFLLSVGSCTCMNMASLMVLEWLLTSLCIILNCSGSIGCLVVVLCR